MPELGELPIEDTNDLIERLADRVHDLAAAAASEIEGDLGPSTDEERRLVDDLIEEG